MSNLKTTILVDIDALKEMVFPGIDEVEILEVALDRQSRNLRIGVDTRHLSAGVWRLDYVTLLDKKRAVSGANRAEDEATAEQPNSEFSEEAEVTIEPAVTERRFGTQEQDGAGV